MSATHRKNMRRRRGLPASLSAGYRNTTPPGTVSSKLIPLEIPAVAKLTEATDSSKSFASDLDIVTASELRLPWFISLHPALRSYYRATVHGNQPMALAPPFSFSLQALLDWEPPQPAWLTLLVEDTLHDPLSPSDRANFEAIGAYGDYLAVHGAPR